MVCTQAERGELFPLSSNRSHHRRTQSDPPSWAINPYKCAAHRVDTDGACQTDYPGVLLFVLMRNCTPQALIPRRRRRTGVRATYFCRNHLLFDDRELDGTVVRYAEPVSTNTNQPTRQPEKNASHSVTISSPPPPLTERPTRLHSLSTPSHHHAHLPLLSPRHP